MLPTNRSPAAGTRSSATLRCRSFHRPRRSRRTCRARSAWPSRCTGRPSSGVDTPWPSDAVVVCSFGDASANHSTATGAINTALNTAYQRLPVPILFVCEDNGLGISVPTPAGWIERTYGSRPGLDVPHGRRVRCGVDVRSRRLPPPSSSARRVGRCSCICATVRFLGHAGSDAEISYRTPTEIVRRLRHRSVARHRDGAGVLRCRDTGGAA